MCGYIGNLHEAPGVIDLMDELGISLPLPYYQAYARRVHPALITHENGQHALSSAMWWYALKPEGGKLIPNPDVTSFNARNLISPLWKNAIRHRRGVVFGTEIGESKGRAHYLMRSQGGLALGALYKDWNSPDGTTLRSMAIITRPPHARFSQYHDQSIPAFLPLDKTVLSMWLDPEVDSSHPVVAGILDNPRLYNEFTVISVKTFKRGEPLGSPETLAPD